MKKIFSIVLTMSIFSTCLFAKEDFLSFSAGVLSGFPVYGSDSVLSTGSEIEKANRVLVGTVLSANLNITDLVTFFTGNDFVCDFTWNASKKSNKFHVSFPVGIKVYPGLGGLNVGLAYTLGFRGDSIKTQKIEEYNGVTPWGNGFKFLVEYNFAHEGKSKYLPTIGGYWNLMPRGNYSYDNLIVFYIAANF